MAIDIEAEKQHKAKLTLWYQDELKYRVAAFMNNPNDGNRTVLNTVLDQWREAAEIDCVRLPGSPDAPVIR
jgi:hypothetical protein